MLLDLLPLFDDDTGTPHTSVLTDSSLVTLNAEDSALAASLIEEATLIVGGVETATATSAAEGHVAAVTASFDATLTAGVAVVESVGAVTAGEEITTVTGSVEGSVFWVTGMED